VSLTPFTRGIDAVDALVPRCITIWQVKNVVRNRRVSVSADSLYVGPFKWEKRFQSCYRAVIREKTFS